MNICTVCGRPCIRSSCEECLDDLNGIEESVLIRFLNASAGRDRTLEKKAKPFFTDVDDLRVELYGIEHPERCPPGDPMRPQPEEED